jgi:hypothetical protein
MWVKIKSKIRVDRDLRFDKTKHYGSYLNNSLMYLHGKRENLGVAKWENTLLTHKVSLPIVLHPTNVPLGRSRSKETNCCVGNFGQNEAQLI